MTIEDAELMLYLASELYGKVAQDCEMLLETLTPREKAVLERFYGLGVENETITTIGRAFHLHPDRIYQIKRKALRKIAAGKPRAEEVKSLLIALIWVSKDVEAIYTAVCNEREACAILIDKQAQGMQVLIDHAPTKIRREDLKRLKHSLNVAAICVRTRKSI